MSFFVYMLKSIERKPVTYVGYTINLKNRIKLHNAGKGARFTRGRKWKLIYKEKVISKNATVGVYYWKHGEDYVKYAEQMIKKNKRVNNEFYVCPVYNEAIADNKKVKSIEVQKMIGMGTPEDLQNFEKKI